MNVQVRIDTDLLTARERDDAEETEDLSQIESVELIIHSEWMTANGRFPL